MLERLVEESGERVVGMLNRHPQVAHYAIMVFGHSRFLGETLVQNPDLLESLLTGRGSTEAVPAKSFRER